MGCRAGGYGVRKVGERSHVDSRWRPSARRGRLEGTSGSDERSEDPAPAATEPARCPRMPKGAPYVARRSAAQVRGAGQGAIGRPVGEEVNLGGMLVHNGHVLSNSIGDQY